MVLSSSHISTSKHRWNYHWRTFAGFIALALGLNLWINMNLLPSLMVGNNNLPLALLFLPVIILVFGIGKQNETVLLFVFPSTLLLLIPLFPEMGTIAFYSFPRFLMIAIGLVVFLFTSSTFTSFQEAPIPKDQRPLKSSTMPVSRRWKRRRRMYFWLAFTSLAFPLILLYRINFDPEGSLALQENYHGRAATFTTLLNVSVIGLWIYVFSVFFLVPLSQHRKGDSSLQQELSRLRQPRTIQSKTSLIFYSLITFLFIILWAILRR